MSAIVIDVIVVPFGMKYAEELPKPYPKDRGVNFQGAISPS